MEATQIILIVFIVALLILYPVLIYTKNKKENQRMQEQTNSLKRGDKVLTTGGLYGTIVDLHLDEDKKIVTIETGTGKNKGYFSVDAYAIYNVFREEEKTEEVKKETKTENKETQKTDTDEKADKESTESKEKEPKEENKGTVVEEKAVSSEVEEKKEDSKPKTKKKKAKKEEEGK